MKVKLTEKRAIVFIFKLIMKESVIYGSYVLGNRD